MLKARKELEAQQKRDDRVARAQARKAEAALEKAQREQIERLRSSLKQSQEDHKRSQEVVLLDQLRRWPQFSQGQGMGELSETQLILVKSEETSL